MAKLGIIVCFYNDEEYLSSLWECLSNLQLKDVNIYFINDHSSDQSYSRISALTKGHTYAHVYTAPSNIKGPGEARNFILDQIDDEYVCFLDADDFVGWDFYQNTTTIMDNLNLEVLRTDWTVVNGKRRTHSKYESNVPINTIQKGIEYFKPYNKSTAFDRAAGCCGIYQKKFLDKFNIRFSSRITGEDRLFVFKCFLFSERCMITSVENGYFYRQEATKSRLTTVGDKKQNEYFIVMKEIVDFYIKSNINDINVWRKLIHQSVALFNLHINRSQRLTKSAYLDLWHKASSLVKLLENCPEFHYVVNGLSKERKEFVKKLLHGEFIYD